MINRIARWIDAMTEDTAAQERTNVRDNVRMIAEKLAASGLLSRTCRAAGVSTTAVSRWRATGLDQITDQLTRFVTAAGYDHKTIRDQSVLRLSEPQPKTPEPPAKALPTHPVVVRLEAAIHSGRASASDIATISRLLDLIG